MELSDSIQEKLQLMDDCIFDDLGKTVNSIVRYARRYAQNGNIENYENVDKTLRKIENFYEQIPFDDLDEQEPVFEPLLEIRDTLPKFRRALKGVFEKGSEDAILLLEAHSGVIEAANIIYLGNFMNYRAAVPNTSFDLIVTGIPEKYIMDPERIKVHAHNDNKR